MTINQYPISIAQSRFLNATTRGRLFISGIGGGKTRILGITAIREAIKNRHTCIVSFSYRTLKDVISKTLVEICDQLDLSYTFNKSEMDFYINNTPILLRSADAPDKLRGLNLNSFLIDEGSSVNRETLDILLGRIRLKDAFWGILSTPRGKNYIYNLIQEEGLLDAFNTGFASNNNLTVITQSTLLSPFLPSEYKDDLCKQYSSSFAQQEIYGQIIEPGGNIFKPDWFIKGSFNPPVKGIRSWDVAVSTKTQSDYSAGCLLSRDNGKYIIHNIKRVKLEYPDLKKLIVKTAIEDGPGIVIGLENAGQQLAIIQDIRRELALNHYIIKEFRPTKDKVTRALPVASQAELSNISINKASWNREFFDECSSFGSDSCVHDDQIDSLTMGYYLLSIGPTQFNALG